MDIGLLDLLLLGAPEGKTELLDGQVFRCVRAETPAAARTVFLSVARDLCRHCDVPWAGVDERASTFNLQRWHLRVDAECVELLTDVTIARWGAFC